MRRLIKRLLLSNVVSFSQSLFNSFKSRVIGNSGVIEADSCAVTTLSNLDSKNLLQSATFVLAPSGYKSGIIYSQVPSNGNGDLTVTRATTATRVNSSGAIETVASGVPQLDYSLGGCPNFLFEPQRTNLLQRSGDLGYSSYWYTISSSTVVSSQATAPDGSLSGALYTEATGVGSPRVFSQGTSITSGGTYCFSIYVKGGTADYFRLILNEVTVVSNWVAAQFRLSTLSYTSGSGSGGGTFVSASIVSVGGGWYRCSLVATISATQVYAFFNTSNGSAISSSDNRGLSFYTVVTPLTMYLWGAQLEQGLASPTPVAYYPTSYIPTTSASVTRNATSFTRSNIYTNGLISASGFTWLFEIKNNLSIKGDQTDNTKFYGMFIGNSSTAPTSAICIYNDNTTALLKLGTISGTTTTARYTTAAASIKVAITYDGTTLNAWVNGTKQISALSFSATLSAFEHLAAVNTDVPKYIAQMALWNTILPDSQCASLTS